MQELELTIFDRGDNGSLVQPVLNEFERLHKIHVNLQLLNWEAGWSKLVEVALYGNGPDLSEVGSTWVMDFVRMHAVNNLTADEVAHLGNEKDFFPTNWHSGVVPAHHGESTITWAIPWTSDVRLAYYRHDLFEKANLDPTHAFEHVNSLSETIQILKSKGIALPMVLPTQRSRISLHLLASWVWDAGGDFLTAEGNQVAFDRPEALRGMSQYFQLGKHIPAAHRKIDDLEADQLFISKDAAMVFSGWWLLANNTTITPQMRKNISMTSMPGASFVGGTHLLTWKHSLKREQAFLLAEFMVKHSAEYNIFPGYSLPAYIPAWEKVKFIAEPYFSAVFDALQKGRSFPIGQLWGLVEKRLTDALPIIWERVFNADTDHVENILAETIIPLARRINITLE